MEFPMFSPPVDSGTNVTCSLHLDDCDETNGALGLSQGATLWTTRC